MSRVISRVTTLITHSRRLISPFITTHEPPRRVQGQGFGGYIGVEVQGSG